MLNLWIDAVRQGARLRDTPISLKVPGMFSLAWKMVSCRAPTAIRVRQVVLSEFDSQLMIRV